MRTRAPRFVLTARASRVRKANASLERINKVLSTELKAAHTAIEIQGAKLAGAERYVAEAEKALDYVTSVLSEDPSNADVLEILSGVGSALEAARGKLK